ncbi:N-acetyltransferase GCN5 [Salinisphaera sp. PC39]
MDIASISPGPQVESLLAEAGLPVADLRDNRALTLLGVRDAGQLVGAVGIEVHGEAGLLRSLAVAPGRRGAGLGRELVSGAETWAVTHGVETLYLLTETAAEYFAGLDYEAVPRSGAPAAIAATRQFSDLCPASAAFMRKRLTVGIRPETDADIDAIDEVTAAAFETLAISSHTEQFIVRALRAAGALSLSLVAEIDGRVVGHIAFSPVTVSDGTPDWYGLGPVSVLPGHQRRGIGKALIREGLSRLCGMGARGCCLVGDPVYYRQFGFEAVPGFVHEGVPPDAFVALSLGGAVPRGTVGFHEAFQATGPVGT